MGKRRKTLIATISGEAFARIASEVVPGHDGWISSGYLLNAKGRLWRRKDGSWTGKFVYASSEEPGFKIDYVVRGIVFTP